jgi:uncharacterized protein DUF2017
VGSIRRRGRRVRVILEDDEVVVVLSLISQVVELLGDGEPAPDVEEAGLDAEVDAASAEALELLLETSAGPVETPQDPALLRLLPDGYRNDDDAAGEFRRLTESSLRSTKRAALQRVIDDLSAAEALQKDGTVRCDLDEAAAEAWLPALTDVRLLVGTRIGVTEDDELDTPTAPPGSWREAAYELYDLVTWLQGAILEALTGG